MCVDRCLVSVSPPTWALSSPAIFQQKSNIMSGHAPTTSIFSITMPLQLTLWYLSFIHPLYVGAKLCRKPSPNPKDVENCAIAFAFLWVLEMADHMLLSELIAMRNVYLLVRILVCLYFFNPNFHGALTIFKASGLKALVESYGSTVDETVTANLKTFRNQGLIEYAVDAGKWAARGGWQASKIALQLVVPHTGKEEGVKED